MITSLFTTFPKQNLFMSDYTKERRTKELISQVMHHPHKEELLKLMQQQLADDATVATESEQTYY